MNHFPIQKRTRAQRGAAAVEMALILPLLLVFLTVPLFFARYYMHYSVAEKAARDAARYLSSVPQAEMLASQTPTAEIEAAKFAKSIATTETAELNPGPGGVLIEVQCNGSLCVGKALPPTVKVLVTIQFSDPIFPVFSSDYATDPLWIVAEVTMPYARQ